MADSILQEMRLKITLKNSNSTVELRDTKYGEPSDFIVELNKEQTLKLSEELKLIASKMEE